jgi:hypothetical protein
MLPACPQRCVSYIWVDTVCIDKTSSVELSEAVNSMYRWYSKAEVGDKESLTEIITEITGIDYLTLNGPLHIRQLSVANRMS